MTTSPTPPLLAMKGISKRFGAVQALKDIELTVSAGEVVAVVGDNGAGKSTLVKVLAGVHHADSGTVSLDGSPVRIGSPTDSRDLGIATVYQDLALCDNLDVVANLWLGREITALGVIDEVVDGSSGFFVMNRRVISPGSCDKRHPLQRAHVVF